MVAMSIGIFGEFATDTPRGDSRLTCHLFSFAAIAFMVYLSSDSFSASWGTGFACIVCSPEPFERDVSGTHAGIGHRLGRRSSNWMRPRHFHWLLGPGPYPFGFFGFVHQRAFRHSGWRWTLHHVTPLCALAQSGSPPVPGLWPLVFLWRPLPFLMSRQGALRLVMMLQPRKPNCLRVRSCHWHVGWQVGASLPTPEF